MPTAVEETVANKAYLNLRKRIIDRDLKPGEPLRQQRMAREMGIAVTPLREAMVRLECEGLIETVPQWGSRVRLFSEQSIQQFYEFREAIESQTARLCCQRATDSELAVLLKLGQEVDDRYDRHDFARGCSVDADFHAKIAEFARSAMLLEQFERLSVLSELTFIERIHGQGSRPNPGGHVRIAKSLASRNPERADAEIRHHLDPRVNTELLVVRRTLGERQ